MADVITCPSGLIGRVRGMKVCEERILTDRKLAKHGGQMDELLASCWEGTLHPGPYDLAEGAKLDSGKVLQAIALSMIQQLAENDELVEALGSDGPHKPLGVRSAVRAPCRNPYALHASGLGQRRPCLGVDHDRG